jgi:outer membrane protein assembly factor BamA
MKRSVSLTLICIVIILQSPGYLRADNSAVSADSSIAFFKALHRKSGWEKAASLPGKVIYFPLKYTMKGFNFSVGYIDETRIVARINDWLTSDDERRGVNPTYASRTGAGIKFYQKGLFGTPSDQNKFKLTFTGWELGRQRYCLDFTRVRMGSDFVELGVTAAYTKLPTEHFYGIGPGSRYDDESDFTHEQTTAEISINLGLDTNVSLRGDIGYEFNHASRGREPGIPSVTELYPLEAMPGLQQEVQLYSGSLGLVIDTKDRPGNPTRGFDFLASGGLHQESGDDRYGFWKYSADLTRYVHLFHDRVLAVRIAAESNDPWEDRSIPFYHLAELGRKETIRGFQRGRFRDRDYLLGSVEYRWPIWRNWDEYGVDFVLFADAGQVTPDLFEELDTDEFKAGFGFGIRMWDQEGLVLKFESAFSEDGWRGYFVLN